MNGNIPMAGVSRRVWRIKISATKEMPMLAARVGGCVSLGQGVPSFPTPEHVLDAVFRTLRADQSASKYSLQPGLPALRQAVTERMLAPKGLSYDPEIEIGITAGAMEALLCAILTLVDEGDEVLAPSPNYTSHLEQILMAGGRPVLAPLRQKDWSLDVEAFERAVTPKTKAILLCNPHNPTGAVFAEADLRALGQLAAKHGLYVISDETYDVLSWDSPAPLPMAAIPEIFERCVTIFSFSKRFALTGWRVGGFAAPRPLTEQMLKVHDAATICAPTPAQHAALAALEGPQEVFEEMRSALRRGRELCCGLLDSLGGAFEYARPGGAFYVMAKYKWTGERSREVAVRLIEQARVVTIPGGSFGPEGEGYLRLSYGGLESEIEEAFARIAKHIGG